MCREPLPKAVWALASLLLACGLVRAEEPANFQAVGATSRGILRMKSLPGDLAKIDLKKSQGVVVNIRMTSEKKEFLPVSTSDFAVSGPAGDAADPKKPALAHKPGNGGGHPAESSP